MRRTLPIANSLFDTFILRYCGGQGKAGSRFEYNLTHRRGLDASVNVQGALSSQRLSDS